MIRNPVFYITALMILSCIAVSCEPEAESFDQSLLIGKWQSGTLFYKYQSDGSGGTWDTGDDVTEAEAQLFTWTLAGSELRHIHILEIGGSVPKIYTVIELTTTSLKYEDDFGVKFSFVKVSK